MKRLIISLMIKTNNILNYIILNRKKCIYGKNLKLNGVLFLISEKKGSIVIGDNVIINSSRKANFVGGTKTTLVTKGNGLIEIGNNTGLSNVTIVSWCNIKIGENVMLGANTRIYDTDFHSLTFEERINPLDTNVNKKPVIIKNGAFIGAHTVILKGVIIGEKSIIGSGAVVTKNVPDGEIWGGNPAKFIKKID